MEITTTHASRRAERGGGVKVTNQQIRDTVKNVLRSNGGALTYEELEQRCQKRLKVNFIKNDQLDEDFRLTVKDMTTYGSLHQIIPKRGYGMGHDIVFLQTFKGKRKCICRLFYKEQL